MTLPSTPLVVLEVRTPPSSEETPQAMSQALAALATGSSLPRWQWLWRTAPGLSLEIVNIGQTIRFCAALPSELRSLVESQLTSHYPKALLTPITDPLPTLCRCPAVALGTLSLAAPDCYPLRTYQAFHQLDPLAAVLGVLSKFGAKEMGYLQLLLSPPYDDWQRQLQARLALGIQAPTPHAPERRQPLPYARLVEEKLSYSGFQTTLRVLVGAAQPQVAQARLRQLAGAFGAFALGEGNRLVLHPPPFYLRQRSLTRLLQRQPDFPWRRQILNTEEVATLWHPPTQLLAGIRNIAWGRTLLGEPPPNLPVATGLSETERQTINFWARTEFKNQMATFGLKRDDRRKHVYVIGKTGTGKSTLIANLAINDMRNGAGLAVLDPHGDLAERLLDYIPAQRINEVVYLEPFDTARPFRLNPLEIKNPLHKELVASGILAIFAKLYSHSWGPRLEYILRNCLLTLVEQPNATLPMVLTLLSDAAFRQRVLANLADPVLQNFWHNEYEAMPARLRSEAIAPIQNKVGQFVASPTIRGILGHPRSTVDLEAIMNNGQILILNLAQGKLGEDNAALLGAMVITQLQLAAMNRVHLPEEERRDFYLYVDEFQNFATSSFVKILSEARKYRLNLILANQYVAQVEEAVQKAIFGNAGTLIAFLLGAQDAQALAHEFGQVYKPEDLVSLGAYQIIVKLAIDNLTSLPFHATTLPLPRCCNQQRAKVIRLAKERYTRPAVTEPT